MSDTFSLFCCRIHFNIMHYGNKIQKLFVQDKLGKEYRFIVCVDGTVFPCTLQGSEQKESFGLQRVFSRELQTADGKLASTGNKQVS